MHTWNSTGEIPFFTIYNDIVPITSVNCDEKLRIIQLFIDNGMDVNVRSGMQGKTLLYEMVSKNQVNQ